MNRKRQFLANTGQNARLANIDNRFVLQTKGEITDKTSTDLTYDTVLKLPCIDCYGVELVYKNNRTTSYDLDVLPVVAVTNSITAGLVEPSTGNTVTGNGATGWVRSTFGGSSSAKTVPARTASKQPSIVVSDFIAINSIAPTDGSGSYPYLKVRTHITNTQNFSAMYHGASWDGVANATDKTSCTFMQTRVRTGDHITNTSTMTNANSNTNEKGETPLAAVIVYSKTQQAVRILIMGDSLVMGQASLVNGYYYYGWAMRSQDLIRAKGYTIQGGVPNFINGGWGGCTTSETQTQMQDLLPIFEPSVLVYSPHSPNDNSGTLTQAVADAQYSRALSVAAYAEARRVRPTFVFISPNDNLNSTTDAYRKSVITNCTATKYKTFNLNSVLGTGATPDRFLKGFTGDNIHLKEEAHQVAAHEFCRQLAIAFKFNTNVVPYDTTKRIVMLNYWQGKTLNGSDVSYWADQSGNGYHFEQTTAAYQPAEATDGSLLLTAANFEGLSIVSGKLGMLKNLDGVECYAVIKGTDYAATRFVLWISTGTSTTAYRYAVRSLITTGQGQQLWRCLDADSGLSISSGTNPPAAGNYYLAFGQLDFTDQVQSYDINGDTVTTSGITTAPAFSGTDSLSIHIGTNPNRFDGTAYNGNVKALMLVSPGTDLAPIVEDYRRTFALWAKTL